MTRSILSVGVGGYSGRLGPLEFSRNDAEAVHSLMTDPMYGGCDLAASDLLLDPHRSRLERAIEMAAKGLTLGDTFFFFFAGHALTSASGDLLLAPTDYSDNYPLSSSISMNFLDSVLDESAMSSVVLILDCCYSGIATTSRRRGAPSPTLLLEALSGRGRVVISSTGTDQQSREFQSLEHGIFTAGLLHGVTSGEADLDADGVIGHSELFRHVYGFVSSRVDQEPTMWGTDLSGEMYISKNPHKEFSEVVWPGDGRRMRRVPRGQALLGETEIVVAECDEFLIDTYPVTVADYRAFADATGRKLPQFTSGSRESLDERPVTHVSYDDALAYALWSGKRLPTEIEWERAARGDEGWLYPWGNTPTPAKCNCRESKIGHTTEVSKYRSGVSPFGVFDMSGNVWEWCATAPESDRAPLRGGSFNSPFATCAPGHANDASRSMRDDDTGFRCAADPIEVVVEGRG